MVIGAQTAFASFFLSLLTADVLGVRVQAATLGAAAPDQATLTAGVVPALGRIDVADSSVRPGRPG